MARKEAALPKVTVFNATSADGRLDWIDVDLELYYGMAMGMRQEAVLTGSGTILQQQGEVPPEDEASFRPPERREDDRRPLFVVVDSRGQVRSWHTFRHWPYFREVMALVSGSTPREYLDYLEARRIGYLVCGRDRVDLREALAGLRSRFGVRNVRVDSGGTLNGVLLREGLVDEVHLLLVPQMVGGSSPRSMFVAPDLASNEGVIGLELRQVRRPKEGHVWLRYQVRRPGKA